MGCDPGCWANRDGIERGDWGRDERAAFVGSRRAGVLFWRGVLVFGRLAVLGLERLSFQIGPSPSLPLPPPPPWSSSHQAPHHVVDQTDLP